MNILSINHYGIYIKETYNRETKLYTATVCNRNGKMRDAYNNNNIIEYSYYKRYYHPLLSWKNLDCCNGWRYNEEYLRYAVQAGLKPAANIVDTLDNIPRDIPTNLIVHINNHWNPKFVEMIVCLPGKIKDYFDFDEIIKAYEDNNVDFKPETLAEIKKYFDLDIIEYLDKYDWKNSEGVELIITGLVLGYPIESTFSLLFM